MSSVYSLMTETIENITSVLGNGLATLLNQVSNLWQRGLDYISTLPRRELAFQIIILSVVFIFVITLILGVAVMILRVRNAVRHRRRSRLERLWERTIFEYLTDESAPVPEIRVNRSNRMFFILYLYRFAQRIRGQEMIRLKALVTPHLPFLVRNLRRGYPELRARNINMLGVLGFPNYIDSVKPLLSDPAPLVSMSAARALAHPDYPQHMALILPVVHQFDTWSMTFLASMLAKMGPEAAADLIAKLKDDQATHRVRIACCEALRKLGILAAADAATEVLETTSETELVTACLRLLGEIGTPRHARIIRGLVRSQQEVVRMHALSALGQIGSTEDGDLIRHGLDDPSRWVALRAARALGTIQRLDLLQDISESSHPNAALAAQVVQEQTA